MERRRLTRAELDSLDFSICGINYVTRRDIEYDGIKVPQGYVFDGVTVKAPFTVIFNSEDLRRGLRASCFHDWLCEHRSEYKRKYATKVLVDLWRANKLGPIKAKIVSICVNVYQLFRGGWKC